MTAPTTPLDRSKTVTTANPTPPTNVPVYYQGTPPMPKATTPHWVDEPQWTTAIPRWQFADPFNGAVATQWTGTDALPVVAELAGKAEADGTEVMTVVGNTVCYGTGDPYTESPNSDHPSGGGDTWPPVDAVIAIDFVNDRAWASGGAVAIDTLIGNDPVVDSGWSTSAYNAANLTASGYPGEEGVAVAFIGAARTALLAGATFSIRFSDVAGGTVDLTFGMLSADGADAVEWVANSSMDNFYADSWGGSSNIHIEGALNHIPDGEAVNKVAATVTATRFDLVANGGTAETTALLEADRPAGNPLVAAFVDITAHVVQSITIYDALPDTDGLSELSEV